MDNTVKTLIVVVVVLIAVLGVTSGFILQSYLSNNNKNAPALNQTNTSTNSNNTAPIAKSIFKNGNMSFQYPSDFQNITRRSDIITGDSNWQTLRTLNNSQGINIVIKRYNGVAEPAGVISDTQNSIRNNNGTVLSTTDQTNSNGVEIFGSIHTLTNPTDNTILRYYQMSFMATGQTYSIQVFGDDSENSNILKVKNIVFNTLKVS